MADGEVSGYTIEPDGSAVLTVPVEGITEHVRLSPAMAAEIADAAGKATMTARVRWTETIRYESTVTVNAADYRSWVTSVYGTGEDYEDSSLLREYLTESIDGMALLNDAKSDISSNIEDVELERL